MQYLLILLTLLPPIAATAASIDEARTRAEIVDTVQPFMLERPNPRRNHSRLQGELWDLQPGEVLRLRGTAAQVPGNAGSQGPSTTR
ncbi:MAG: hypothetical protein QNJ40_07335 [Xanthomonadales bacterium]|nr:hypothetical protein [Xanthomonadales bacterium]